MTTPDDGWHFGPDGTPERGFLEGTAFQPDEVMDHIDAWGSVHPYNLRDCPQCRAENLLIT